eukprot:CAMPEP_0170478146 /NCGR_PEP_ID=MMETSP0123-20130129/19254_1 /TAXON_ID=182087 /ORGANISM="Favella ehrenbergii, Strain Fehren 1" /LENGTH=141 /DNA_ID=CAMNT_0010750279 /DNA_START=198 /DNA_END=623 /DNA_ORIENTATION=+
MREFLSEDEFAAVVDYHYQISVGLGIPVGLINMLHRVPPSEAEIAPTQKYAVENLHDRVQNMLGRLLEKTNGGGSASGNVAEAAFYEEVKDEIAEVMPFGLADSKPDKTSDKVDTEGKIVENDLKKQFMTFLHAKDDNLLL